MNSTWEWVKKYTEQVLKKETGTPNNNYKHLIGSCRKITRGMATKELEKEWSLKLISAYSFYCVNEQSYIKNGNDSFYDGLKIFYKEFCEFRYVTFKQYYNEYIESLKSRIDNESFGIILILF